MSEQSATDRRRARYIKEAKRLFDKRPRKEHDALNLLISRVVQIELKVDWLIDRMTSPPPIIVPRKLPEISEEELAELRKELATFKSAILCGDTQTTWIGPEPPIPLAEVLSHGED